MATETEFHTRKVLGKGGFGEVFEGFHHGTRVAVKRILLTEIDNNGREEDALQKLDHQNVVKLYGVKCDSEFKYFYLELCAASLDKLFLKDENPHKYSGPMPLPIEVLHQLAGGLKYIHDMKLIHRDIKPQNVLIWKNTQTEEVLMKWADFGFSKPVTKSGSHSISGPNRGTDNWYAPEILEINMQEEENGNDETAYKRGTIKSDVFAEGLVFGYYFLKGYHLFGSRFEANLNIKENKSVNLKKIGEQNVRELIEKMLEPKPESRISSSEVFQLLDEMKNDESLNI